MGGCGRTGFFRLIASSPPGGDSASDQEIVLIRGTPPFAGEGLGEDSNSGNFLNKFAVLRSRTRVLPPPTRCLNVPFAVTVFIWKDSRAEFPDCLIGMRHLELGCQATATFDQRATKLPGFNLFSLC